jgi:hypothetical protein
MPAASRPGAIPAADEAYACARVNSMRVNWIRRAYRVGAIDDNNERGNREAQNHGEADARTNAGGPEVTRVIGLVHWCVTLCVHQAGREVWVVCGSRLVRAHAR